MDKKSSNIGLRSTPEWNDNIHDLSSMKLNKEEKAKLVASRQSHNMSIAKAELMDRNRQLGMPQTFSPGVTSRLRATGNKSIEEALADSSSALALAHKIKNEEAVQAAYSRNLTSTKNFHLSNPSSPRERSGLDLAGQRDAYTEEPGIKCTDDGSLVGANADYLGSSKKVSDLSLVQKSGGPSEASMNLYPLSPQGWDNLNNTIQLVVKTCEALWQQLEEERNTRERLHMQLQEQRSIITTLTAELLQIQEHQELIMRELHSSRSPALSSFAITHGAGLRQPHSIPSDLLRDRVMLPPSLAERFAGRPFALSDSSIDRKKHLSGDGSVGELSADELDYDPSPRMLRRLQGKSKSALQLNQEQDSYRLNHIPDESLIEMLRNYQLNDR